MKIEFANNILVGFYRLFNYFRIFSAFPNIMLIKVTLQDILIPGSKSIEEVKVDIAHVLHLIVWDLVPGSPKTQTMLSSPFTTSALFGPIFIAIAILALFLTITTYLRTPSRKKLDWELVSDDRLLNVGNVIKNRVQILLDNRPVEDLCLVVLKIWNSGTVTIHPTDFLNKRPMRFDFGGAEVLDAGILDTTSKQDKEEAMTSLKCSSRTVAMGPLLLKSRDAITLKVLLTKHTAGKVNAKINIAGIKHVQAHVSVLEIPKKSLLLWSLIFVLGGQGSGYGLQFLLQPYVNKFALLFSAFIFVVILFLKGLGSSVFLFHGLLLIGLARGRMMKMKTMRDVLVFWIIISALTSIPVGILAVIAIISLR